VWIGRPGSCAIGSRAVPGVPGAATSVWEKYVTVTVGEKHPARLGAFPRSGLAE
jgi:hypothetical protein